MTHPIICSSASIPFTEQTIVPINTGLGWRHFTPSWMSGINLFFDHDLSRYHSRAGLGAEYYADYLKLSSNAYIGLTGYKRSTGIDNDYEARPANGWDLRAEGWLPACHNWVENWSMNNTMVMKWRCLTRMIAKVIPMLLLRSQLYPLPASDSQCGTASGETR